MKIIPSEDVTISQTLYYMEKIKTAYNRYCFRSLFWHWTQTCYETLFVMFFIHWWITNQPFIYFSLKNMRNPYLCSISQFFHTCIEFFCFEAPCNLNKSIQVYIEHDPIISLLHKKWKMFKNKCQQVQIYH